MGFSDSVDELLASRSASFARGCLAACLITVFSIDLAVACALRAAPTFVLDGDERSLSWTPRDLLSALANFHGDTVDMVLLCLVRVLVMFPLIWLGVRVGTPRLADLAVEPEASCGGATCCGVTSSTATAPLLINAGPSGAEPTAQPDSGARGSRPARGPGFGLTHTASGLTLTHEVKEEHLLSHQRKTRAERRKNIVCGFMFLVASTVQVYMGIKCIGFDCDWHARPTLKLVQAILFLTTLALVNLESFLAKRMVMVGIPDLT